MRLNNPVLGLPVNNNLIWSPTYPFQATLSLPALKPNPHPHPPPHPPQVSPTVAAECNPSGMFLCPPSSQKSLTRYHPNYIHIMQLLFEHVEAPGKRCAHVVVVPNPTPERAAPPETNKNNNVPVKNTFDTVAERLHRDMRGAMVPVTVGKITCHLQENNKKKQK